MLVLLVLDKVNVGVLGIVAATCELLAADAGESPFAFTALRITE
jgi:hypothetical protein